MEKNQVLSGFAAFGGGRYQCPGRYSFVGVISSLCGCGFLYVSTLCISGFSLPLCLQVVRTNGNTAVYSRCVAYV